MRMFKVKRLVETEVSAEEVIAALRAAFDPANRDCPFRVGDIVDITEAMGCDGAKPVVDYEGEPVQAAYVETIDTNDNTLEISYIDSEGNECINDKWVKWDGCVLLDRKY